MDYGNLPFTGAGLAFGGIVISQSMLLGIALLAVLLGTAAIRFGWRRGVPADANAPLDPQTPRRNRSSRRH